MLFWFYYLLIQKLFIGHLLYSPPPFLTKLASNLMMDALLNKGILDNALMDDHMDSVVQELFLWLRWMVWRTEKSVFENLLCAFCCSFKLHCEMESLWSRAMCRPKSLKFLIDRPGPAHWIARFRSRWSLCKCYVCHRREAHFCDLLLGSSKI